MTTGCFIGDHDETAPLFVLFRDKPGTRLKKTVLSVHFCVKTAKNVLTNFECADIIICVTL